MGNLSGEKGAEANQQLVDWKQHSAEVVRLRQQVVGILAKETDDALIVDQIEQPDKPLEIAKDLTLFQIFRCHIKCERRHRDVTARS